MTEVLPASGERVDAAAPDARAWLAERYRRDDDTPVRLNMIASLTGAAAGADGTSDTLTSRLDRAILATIRSAADVVLVGAQSVRAEGYIVPRAARLAVVSVSGDLGGHRLDPERAAAGGVLLLVPEDADATAPAGVELVRVAGSGQLAPADVLGALRARGLDHVVCEGGPGLASQFAAAGLIDEYCVTVAPTLTPAVGPFLRLASPVDTEVRGHLVDEDGFSYLRLRVRRDPAAPASR